MTLALRPGPRYTVQQTLPHRAEMLLLDAIDDYGRDWVRASLTVRATDVFFEPGLGVPAWVGLEYMAQTIGVFSGIEQLQRGLTPSVAMLVGARRYRSDVDVFREGEQLTMNVRLALHEDPGGDDLVVFDCELASGGQMVARAEIKAFRPADVPAFLAKLGVIG